MAFDGVLFPFDHASHWYKVTTLIANLSRPNFTVSSTTQYVLGICPVSTKHLIPQFEFVLV